MTENTPESQYKLFFNLWKHFSRKYPGKAINLENKQADIMHHIFTKYDPNRGKFITFAYNTLRGRFNKTDPRTFVYSIEDFPETTARAFNHKYEVYHVKNYVKEMKNLSNQEKTVLMMTLDGMDEHDISPKLNVKLKTIRSYYLKGLRKLKDHISRKEKLNDKMFSESR